MHTCAVRRALPFNLDVQLAARVPAAAYLSTRTGVRRTTPTALFASTMPAALMIVACPAWTHSQAVTRRISVTARQIAVCCLIAWARRSSVSEARATGAIKTLDVRTLPTARRTQVSSKVTGAGMAEATLHVRQHSHRPPGGVTARQEFHKSTLA